MRLFAVAASAAASVAATQPAAAQGQDSLVVGAGGATIDRPYRGMDNKNIGIPLVNYENQWVSVGLPMIDLKAFDAGPVSLRLRARYSFDGYKASDSNFFQGMDDRKDSAWLGAAAIWRTDMFSLSGEVLADVTNHSKGTRAKFTLDHRYSFGSLGVTPRLGGEWVDSKYVTYYYGVKDSEAIANRPAYEGGSTFNEQAGLRLDYSFAGHHNVFVDAGYTHFGNSIKDSPLVDRTGQGVFSLGYLYRF
jgi:outer membrane protein